MFVQECIICGHQKANIFCSKDGYNYLTCIHCSHVFIESKRGSLLQVEPESSEGTHHVSKAKQDWDFSELKKNKVFGPRLGKIVSYTNLGSLLDIGCANGAFLRAAEEKGWIGCGIELRKMSAKVAQGHGLKVYTETLEKLSFSPQSFSAITLWQVLEHLVDPEGVLLECCRILEPGGVLALSTPNVKSIGWLLLKKNWPAIDPSCHWHLFNPSNLEQLLFRCGFEKCSMQTLDLQPATVKQVMKKIRKKKIEKPTNTVASLVSSSNSSNLKILFAFLAVLNYPMTVSGLGEDIYGYFKKR